MQSKRFLSAALVCLSALGARAQTNISLTEPIQTNMPGLTASAEPDRKPRVLSLSECIQLALQNNLDIRIQRYNPLISQFNLDTVYAGYEPVFNVSARKSYTSSPGGINSQTLIPFASIERESINYNAGLSGVLPYTGLNYNLTGPLSKSSTPNSTNPASWSASPGITLQQPLLKNFWIDNTRLQIQVDKANLKISEQTLLLQVMNTVTAVKTAYYNLIFSQENVKVNETALKLAQELASQNKMKVQIGSLAPLDERQAESQAESSKAALLASQHALAIQENTLKNLLTGSYSEWADISPVPAEQLEVVPLPLNRQTSWRRALAQRPDLLQEKLGLEKQNVTLRYTYNQLFPELDLTGSYGRSSFSPSLGTALDDVATEKDPFYSYGVVITIPLGNTAARNTHKAGKAVLQQLLLQLKQLENTILVTVDNDVGQVRSTLQQVEATRAARIYAEDALDAERKKLENGKSTSFQVLQLISALTTARSSEIRAAADYNIARAQLSLDEGGTLEDNHIDFKVK